MVISFGSLIYLITVSTSISITALVSEQRNSFHLLSSSVKLSYNAAAIPNLAHHTCTHSLASPFDTSHNQQAIQVLGYVRARTRDFCSAMTTNPGYKMPGCKFILKRNQKGAK